MLGQPGLSHHLSYDFHDRLRPCRPQLPNDFKLIGGISFSIQRMLYRVALILQHMTAAWYKYSHVRTMCGSIAQ